MRSAKSEHNRRRCCLQNILSNHLYWSMVFLPGEAHDYDSQYCQAIKSPLSKAEVVNEAVDVCWNNVTNSQKTLKERGKKCEILMITLNMHTKLIFQFKLYTKERSNTQTYVENESRRWSVALQTDER